MSIRELKSSIAKLETEVAALKAQFALAPSPRKDWWNTIANTRSSPKDRAIAEKAAWYGRQWRESHVELEPTPALASLRLKHNAIIIQLKKLGRFKSKHAAAEYAHREFTQ